VGTGAKCIGGEIKVRPLSGQLSSRNAGTLFFLTRPFTRTRLLQVSAIKEFERHSRLGFVTKEGFLEEIERLRDIGFKRVTLKTGAYSMVETGNGAPLLLGSKD
jgi:hypothetical protein